MKTIDFLGDGRVKLYPPDGALGAEPKPVTRAQARQIIMRFNATGYSFHSKRGHTLWITLAHCFQERIPFWMGHEPDGGTSIERRPSDYAERTRAIADAF